jgi:hypothetical protein
MQELTLESSIPYLLHLGLIDLSSIVREGAQVEEVPGRNRNFRVIASRQGWFLKQAPRDEIGTEVPLAVEALVYRWVATDPGAAGLRSWFPSLRHYDAESSILILDVIGEADHPDLLEDESFPERPIALRRLLATAMAEWHALSAQSMLVQERLPEGPPWVLDLTRPSPFSLRELSQAQLSVLRAVQSQPAVRVALDRLRRDWRASALVHGDVKCSNVLVREDGAGSPTQVVVVDWEMAQLGDPSWDVAGALHGFITEAVMGLDLADDTGAQAAAELLGAVATRLRPAHRDFCRDYIAAARLSEAEAGALLGRLPGHVAARLLQSAYEWGDAEPEIPRRAAALLQLGINMLLEPGEAGEVVLGLGRQSAART